jgi:hypothetical protein
LHVDKGGYQPASVMRRRPCCTSVSYTGSSATVRWNSAVAIRSSSLGTSTTGSSRPAKPRCHNRGAATLAHTVFVSSSVAMSTTRPSPMRSYTTRPGEEATTAGHATSVVGQEEIGAGAAAMASSRGRGAALHGESHTHMTSLSVLLDGVHRLGNCRTDKE